MNSSNTTSHDENHDFIFEQWVSFSKAIGLERAGKQQQLDMFSAFIAGAAVVVGEIKKAGDCKDEEEEHYAALFESMWNECNAFARSIKPINPELN